MKKLRARVISLRDLIATAWPIIFISAVGFYVAYQFVKPAPPSVLTISTGPESSVYEAFAKKYAKLLAENGITLKIVSSVGSVENIDRVRRGDVDVAFVQSGQPFAEDDLASGENELRSLGSVAYEPVWVFYRSEERLERLYQLRDKRIAVGADNSGLRGLARSLLEVNQMRPNKNWVSVEGDAAAQALVQGHVDAAFIVAAPESPVVRQLLRAPGVKLMSFKQADAYLKRFASLDKVVLPQGVVDLVKDVPPADTVLLTATANLVARKDLHPALASLLLQAMTEVNGKSGFFQKEGEFPAYKDRSVLLSEEAARYYKSGAPFLQRFMPFWVAVLVDRLFVLVVPIFVLLFPLLRVAPTLYSWRVRSKVFRCYGELKFLENDLRTSFDPAQRAVYLKQLQCIEDYANSLSIPLSFSDLVYTLREHINFVRRYIEMQGLEGVTEPHGVVIGDSEHPKGDSCLLI